jgi:hypothetical protein
MNYLIDTHVFLWHMQGNEQLPRHFPQKKNPALQLEGRDFLLKAQPVSGQRQKAPIFSSSLVDLFPF